MLAEAVKFFAGKQHKHKHKPHGKMRRPKSKIALHAHYASEAWYYLIACAFTPAP